VEKQMKYDVVIVGGFGHVGLPLAISLADKGCKVCALDINEGALRTIGEGHMPFHEEGAEPVLRRTLANGKLVLSLDPQTISQTDTVVVIIGTPVDRHLNPEFEQMRQIMTGYLPHLRDGQLLVLRSTVYPGISEKLRSWIRGEGKQIEVAFCPERIAEGFAMKELETLPQIVSSFSEEGVERARALFGRLTPQIIAVPPIEAELAKLFSNVWRYIKFAAANQFFMIANDQGADFYRIHHAMTTNYERCRDLPGPGFAAGPCLFKDAMQLAAFNKGGFYMGHAAMLVNEGLPNYVVDQIKRTQDLRNKTVGILGMAFKANIDDKRESLSYKLKKILLFEARHVLCSDVHIDDPDLVSTEELLRRSDVIIVGTPHREYRDLQIPADKLFVDVWNMSGQGCVI
jgi:UDP-N-acetyl-D-mannosaminuronic acid dehydrogenase